VALLLAVSTIAPVIYNVNYGGFIQPRQTEKRLVVFDLPVNGNTFYLVPHPVLADPNGKSILFVIPE
jgi:hypothetical protein